MNWETESKWTAAEQHNRNTQSANRLEDASGSGWIGYRNGMKAAEQEARQQEPSQRSVSLCRICGMWLFRKVLLI